MQCKTCLKNNVSYVAEDTWVFCIIFRRARIVDNWWWHIRFNWLDSTHCGKPYVDVFVISSMCSGISWKWCIMSLILVSLDNFSKMIDSEYGVLKIKAGSDCWSVQGSVESKRDWYEERWRDNYTTTAIGIIKGLLFKPVSLKSDLIYGGLIYSGQSHGLIGPILIFCSPQKLH